jgi:2-pyrone-4,6-dicarboxylate lactonase
MPHELPRGAWDSQVHVFGGPYPLSPKRAYDPPVNSDLDSMLKVHSQFGFEFGVVVQAAAQGFETRYVADVLRRLPHYAGVILMNEQISDKELADLHAAGVRGGRFVFLPGYEVRPDYSTLRRALPRLKELGWFAKIFATAGDWVEIKPYLDDIDDMPVMIDHLGYVDPSAGLEQPPIKIILELLERENWWMMLSCGDRISKTSDWSDVIPYAKAFIDAAPDRVVWGSDWPHVAHNGAEPKNEAVLNLLFQYTQDPEQIHKIFVTNPGRFFKR